MGLFSDTCRSYAANQTESTKKKRQDREYKEIPPLTIKQVDRFYSKYVISTTPPNFSSPCWNWTGTVSRGYGRLSIGKLWFKAHRISYYLHHKELPTNLTLDHLCKNTICVNPDHLEPVTSEENLSRRKRDWTKGLCNKGVHDLSIVGYRTQVPQEQNSLQPLCRLY